MSKNMNMPRKYKNKIKCNVFFENSFYGIDRRVTSQPCRCGWYLRPRPTAAPIGHECGSAAAPAIITTEQFVQNLNQNQNYGFTGPAQTYPAPPEDGAGAREAGPGGGLLLWVTGFS